MVFALPSRLYLPRRGPSTTAPASAHQPPTAWTTPLPAKSMYPFPRPILPSCESQPPPQVRYPNEANAAELKGETCNEVPDHAKTVDHEIHTHGMTGVLGTTEPRFDEREAGLHKHD